MDAPAEASERARPDALVVGAGPVGLVAAVDLARRGVGVRIIDTLTVPTDESRAVVLHARSLELMDQLGVLDEIRGLGVRTTGAELHADGSVLAHVGLGSIDSPFPYSITIAQTDTERVLTDRLHALGVQIERGVTFSGLDQDGTEVRATLTHGDGSTEIARTRWLIGADGARSTVRGSLGLKLEGSFKGERFLMGDVDADYPHDRYSFHIFFSPGEAAGMLFPMAGRRARVICQIPDQTPASREPSIDWLQESADERGMQVKLESARWLTIFEIHHAQVPRYRTGRVFLAGDAAHVHSPAGGLGMNTGIQDAFNLSWKIATACSGAASEALLDSYHAERYPVAADVITFSTDLTRIGTLGSPFARELRNVFVKAALKTSFARHSMANEIEQMTVEYRYSPLVQADEHGAVRAGDALKVVHEVDLWGAVLEGDHGAFGHTAVLVASRTGTLPAYVPPDGFCSVRVAPDGGEGILADPDGHVARRYGLGERGGVILVRPDGYLAALCNPEHTADIADYFTAISADHQESE